jgi:flagellar hook protein FlgE
MLQALLAGVASIKAQQTRMNVIGNNLANVNTTAYKGSRVTFQDMLSQTIRGSSKPTGSLGGTNPMQFGLGVLVAGTDVSNEQGSLSATNRPTDLALQGSGFFMVSNGDRVAYTRDGSFDLDANGDMVHRATGERVVGWTADPATGLIDTNQPIGPGDTLNVPLGARTAVQVTTQASWAGNLDAREAISAPIPAYPNAGYRTSTIRVFDQLGSQHDLTVAVIKSAANTWDWQVVGQNGTTVTGTGQFVFSPATGTMTSGGTGSITVTPPAGGASAFPVTMDFSRLSQLGTDTQIQASNQNGFPPGSLGGFSVNTDGVITGIYTNGLTRSMGQLSISVFPNANGLERTGQNLWRDTDNSGIPVIGAPRTGGRGAVSSGFLEQSNIDIGNEFTDLIVTQRGFQANTRVVTTVDEMLQDLLNMKR